MAGKPEASIAGWKKALELNPSGQLIFLGLGDGSAMAGKDREAFGYYQQALAAGLAGEKVLSDQAKAYQSGGLYGYTRKWLERTEEEESSGDIWTYSRAKLHARVGNRKEALIWLDKAFQEHHNRLIYLKVEPDFEKMRSDPEYLNLMRKVGLPP
jgi:tetratricopeptide (TPR) repeat protein